MDNVSISAAKQADAAEMDALPIEPALESSRPGDLPALEKPPQSDNGVDGAPQTAPVESQTVAKEENVDARQDPAKEHKRGATTRWTFKCFVDNVDIITDTCARGPKLTYAACPHCFSRYRLDRETNADTLRDDNSISAHTVRYVVSFLLTPGKKPRAPSTSAPDAVDESPAASSRNSAFECRSIEAQVESDSYDAYSTSWSSIAINLSDLESESALSGNGGRSNSNSPKVRAMSTIGVPRPLSRLRSGGSSSSSPGLASSASLVQNTTDPSATHTPPATERHVHRAMSREDLKSLLHTWWRVDGEDDFREEKVENEAELFDAPPFLQYLREQVERRDALLRVRSESLWRQKATVQRLEKQFQQQIPTLPESGSMTLCPDEPFVRWAHKRRQEAADEDAKKQILYWHNRRLLFRYLLSTEARHTLYLIRQLRFMDTATSHNQAAARQATRAITPLHDTRPAAVSAAQDRANEELGRTIIELTERHLAEVVPAMIRQLFHEQILSASMLIEDEDLAAKDLALSLKIEAISTKGANVLRVFVDFPSFFCDLWKEAPISFPASVVAGEDMHRFLRARDPQEKMDHVNRARDTLASFASCAQSFFNRPPDVVPHFVIIGLWYLLVLRSADDAHGLLANVEFCKHYVRWRGQDCAASLKGLSLALSLIERVNASMLAESDTPQWKLCDAWECNDWSTVLNGA